MGKEFDAEIDAIVGAYKAVTDQAARQILDARTAVAAFTKGWDACRNGIVLPTLSKIVATLAEKQMESSVAVLPAGIELYVPYPGRASVRGQGQPHMTIASNPNTSRVEFKHAHGGGGADGNYTLADITPQLIEKHVLALVREVYR
jgi:hypothetical protein